MAMGGEAITGNADTYQHGTIRKKKNLSQEAIDKIVYDVMSSDQGLAALGSGEASSGGFGSTSKTLMAQDLMTKLAGEIALITAEETQTNDMRNDSSTPLNQFFGEPKSLGQTTDDTVICSELVRQGSFDKELYRGGHKHFLTLKQETIKGYHVWAKPVARWMRTSNTLSAFMYPIVLARYEYIVRGKLSSVGLLTVYIGQPLCYIIGCVASLIEGVKNGRGKQRSA